MNLKQLAVLFFACLFSLTSTQAGDESVAAIEQRRKALSKLPTELRTKWKKFGEWDYKQFDAVYRDFTAYNFGATGSAAGFSSDQIKALVRLASPTPHDISYMSTLDLPGAFVDKEAGILELLEMLKIDSHLSRVSDDFTSVVDTGSWPKGKAHLEGSRLKDYRKRFESLGLREGILRRKGYSDAVFFIVSAEGLCVAGSGCGYVYSAVDLPRVEADAASALGTFAKENPKSGGAVVFQRLKDHWYAFYEVDWQ